MIIAWDRMARRGAAPEVPDELHRFQDRYHDLIADWLQVRDGADDAAGERCAEAKRPPSSETLRHVEEHAAELGEIIDGRATTVHT